MSEVDGQLELLAFGARVPQANSLRLLIELIERVANTSETVADLAEIFEVAPRTARWYADLARWLGFMRRGEGDELVATESGASFAENVSARGRLFSKVLFEKEVVKLANAFKRQALDAGEVLSTRDACRRAIGRTTELAEATVERRASSLARLLDAAYQPSRIDWESGETIDRGRQPPLEFAGESFLTALGVSELGVDHRLAIGFPRQVLDFSAGRLESIRTARWKRASWTLEDGTRWFGSVPINDTTREIALRGGRDLRQLLVVTAPYVSLLCAFLSLHDPLERSLSAMTSDIFGLRLWYRQVELGPPLEVLGSLAESLGVERRPTPPKLFDPADETTREAGDEALREVLLTSGICRKEDTVVALAPGVASEWRDAGGEAPSVEERLAPLRAKMREALRVWI